jgi:hypothetical protein
MGIFLLPRAPPPQNHVVSGPPLPHYFITGLTLLPPYFVTASRSVCGGFHGPIPVACRRGRKSQFGRGLAPTRASAVVRGSATARPLQVGNIARGSTLGVCQTSRHHLSRRDCARTVLGQEQWVEGATANGGKRLGQSSAMV